MNTVVLVAEKLMGFIKEISFSDDDRIKEDTLLFAEGIFDSLGFLSLVSYLSDEFGIDVSNDELNEENFESINAIVAFIEKKKS